MLCDTQVPVKRPMGLLLIMVTSLAADVTNLHLLDDCCLELKELVKKLNRVDVLTSMSFSTISYHVNIYHVMFKARLDSGNEEMIQKLKKQLQETHEDLEQSKQELWNKEEQVQAVKQEV